MGKISEKNVSKIKITQKHEIAIDDRDKITWATGTNTQKKWSDKYKH